MQFCSSCPWLFDLIVTTDRYHPQTNDGAERVNRTMAPYYWLLCSTNVRKIGSFAFFLMVEFAYNTWVKTASSEQRHCISRERASIL